MFNLHMEDQDKLVGLKRKGRTHRRQNKPGGHTEDWVMDG